MATPIAHKGVVAGAKAQAMTLLDLLTRPELLTAAWDYFRNVQTKTQKYVPFIRPTDQPHIELNKAIMDEYAPQLEKFYYNPAKYPTYLDQLGIHYPTAPPHLGQHNAAQHRLTVNNRLHRTPRHHRRRQRTRPQRTKSPRFSHCRSSCRSSLFWLSFPQEICFTPFALLVVIRQGTCFTPLALLVVIPAGKSAFALACLAVIPAGKICSPHHQRNLSSRPKRKARSGETCVSPSRH